VGCQRPLPGNALSSTKKTIRSTCAGGEFFGFYRSATKVCLVKQRIDYIRPVGRDSNSSRGPGRKSNTCSTCCTQSLTRFTRQYYGCPTTINLRYIIFRHRQIVLVYDNRSVLVVQLEPVAWISSQHASSCPIQMYVRVGSPDSDSAARRQHRDRCHTRVRCPLSRSASRLAVLVPVDVKSRRLGWCVRQRRCERRRSVGVSSWSRVGWCIRRLYWWLCRSASLVGVSRRCIGAVPVGVLVLVYPAVYWWLCGRRVGWCIRRCIVAAASRRVGCGRRISGCAGRCAGLSVGVIVGVIVGVFVAVKVAVAVW